MRFLFIVKVRYPPVLILTTYTVEYAVESTHGNVSEGLCLLLQSVQARLGGVRRVASIHSSIGPSVFSSPRWDKKVHALVWGSHRGSESNCGSSSCRCLLHVLA